jgi:protein SCO1/2
MIRLFYVLVLTAACVACFSQADSPYSPTRSISSQIYIEQKLDAQIPLESKFRDEAGMTVSLRELYRGKPVVLALIYYKCPMLCNQVMNGLLAAMKVMKFDAGKEYDVIFVGIDPREGPEVAAKKKESYILSYNRDGAASGWHFLTGDEDQIQQIAKAVGFGYTFDENMDQYAHAACIMVSTPDGRLSKYFYGIEYSARDLRLALVEASEGKIGTFVDAATLYCFAYDPTTGKYGLAIMRVLQAGGILTVLVLAISIVLMVRREKKRKMSPERREGES